MSFTATPRNEASLNGFGPNVASSALPATLAGSLIIAAFSAQLATGNSTSVTDNQGNTYNMVPLANPGASQRHMEIWYAIGAVAGVTAVTVNNASSLNVAGSVTEWPASSPVTLRTQASLANAGSQNPPAAVVTPAIGDLVLGCMGYQASVASTIQEHPADASYTPLTRQTRGTTSMFAGGYKIATTATSTGPSWTLDAVVSTGEVTAVFTQATGNPTAAFSSSAAGRVASFDGSASAAQGSASISSYAWNFGDTNTGAGVSPSHTYGAAGTYTVTLTVTDSLGQTSTVSHQVTAVDPAAQVTPTAVVSSTGWTVTGAAGNALTAVSDTDQATYVVSPATPSGSTFRVTLAPMITPAAGTDMTVTVEVDVTGATTGGTASAKLYEGATVRAVAAAQNLAAAISGANTTALLTFTFAAASIANVTSWNALQVEFTVNAS